MVPANLCPSEYRLLDKDAAEYDFRDFRWARLERVRRGAKAPGNGTGDELLFEFDAGDSLAPSTAQPALDAMDVDGALQGRATTKEATSDQMSLEPGGQMEGGTSDSASDLEMPWDWSWILGEFGLPRDQTGEPQQFWDYV